MCALVGDELMMWVIVMASKVSPYPRNVNKYSEEEYPMICIMLYHVVFDLEQSQRMKIIWIMSVGFQHGLIRALRCWPPHNSEIKGLHESRDLAANPWLKIEVVFFCRRRNKYMHRSSSSAMSIPWWWLEVSDSCCYRWKAAWVTTWYKMNVPVNVH